MGHVVLAFRVAALLVTGLIAIAAPASAAAGISGALGLTVSVDPSGSYDIQLQTPAWDFGGNVGASLANLAVGYGTDTVGDYSEISFDFQTDALRHGAIRTYQNHQVVLFTLNCPSGAPNSVTFPSLIRYPSGLNHFGYSGMFANATFTSLPGESPWAFFDSAANTFIVSPAANFMMAQNALGPNGEIQSGIAPGIAVLPAGFTHQVLLVVENGVNPAFATWGRALTDLHGKNRPSNDADISLSQLGYWTDNGASYYYHTEASTAASMFGAANPYEQTLGAVKSSFDALHIHLGSLQLDSWFYPKGPRVDWSDSADGIYQYLAAPTLFGTGLAPFQQTLGVPLITHARWIDASSPYRQQYQISGNVSTDPAYWSMVASYLKSSGVSVYEQDWLGAQAQTNFNLTDPDAFLDNMAAAMAQQNIDMQYCMATPRHFLQTSKYSNLTTIRASGDRFESSKWTAFLYSSRLAGALGVWPFTDVFMSSETGNLVLATLSAGPVGVGDRLGTISGANLLHAVRQDGVIVKPDVPITPLDSTFLNDAQAAGTPMIAATNSDFGGVRTHYVFAFPQGTSTEARFHLSDIGMNGPAYLYDYFAGAGRIVDVNDEAGALIANGYVYWIAAPVGKSGMAILGDLGHYASMGKKRVSDFLDNGTVHLTVQFAAGESTRTIQGYSPDPPRVSAVHGSAGTVVYDPATQRFQVPVMPGPDGAATIQLRRVRTGTHILP